MNEQAINALAIVALTAHLPAEKNPDELVWYRAEAVAGDLLDMSDLSDSPSCETFEVAFRFALQLGARVALAPLEPHDLTVAVAAMRKDLLRAAARARHEARRSGSREMVLA
jgi:hypothetical protein